MTANKSIAPVELSLMFLSAICSAYLAGFASMGFPDGNSNMIPIYVYPGIVFAIFFLFGAYLITKISLLRILAIGIIFIPLCTGAYFLAVLISISIPNVVSPPYSFILAGGVGAALVWILTQLLRFRFELRSLAKVTLGGLIGGAIFFCSVHYLKPASINLLFARTVAYLGWQLPVGVMLFRRLK